MTSRHFDGSLGCLVSPVLDELATQLSFVAGLSARERDVITSATRESLCTVLHSKLSRLLVLELNAARETGRLSGDNPEQRWQQFIELSSQRPFWDDLASHYPSLWRVDAIARKRCTATLRFAQRWAADRRRLEHLCAGDPGELNELSFGAGDSHCGGLTVAIVRGEGGRVVYKPRSLAIDRALRGFIAELAGDHGSALSVRVPEAVDCDDYGWSEFVTHRFAAGNEELLGFYRGIGHLLAFMRLLSGSDLHAENVIAHGGSPVVIDCETLFTPKIPPSPSGYGRAFDRADELIARTVFSAGLLPGRGMGLGFRGVDLSAVGMLPGQQPMQQQIGILSAGSDNAHVGPILVEASVSQNHPSPRPALADYWPEVLRGFDELTVTLQRLDAAGSCARGCECSRIAASAWCCVRRRSTPRSAGCYGILYRCITLIRPGSAPSDCWRKWPRTSPWRRAIRQSSMPKSMNCSRAISHTFSPWCAKAACTGLAARIGFRLVTWLKPPWRIGALQISLSSEI